MTRACTEGEIETLCRDCRTETIPSGGPHEWYMVHDEVWREARMPTRGFLCIGCLERRLGRMLGPSDFTAAPVNQWPGKSARLAARLIRPRQQRRTRRFTRETPGQLELRLQAEGEV